MSSRFYVYCHDGTGCPAGFVFTVMMEQDVQQVLWLQVLWLDCYRMSIQFCVCRHGRTECQKLVLCLQAWWNRMSNRFCVYRHGVRLLQNVHPVLCLQAW